MNNNCNSWWLNELHGYSILNTPSLSEFWFLWSTGLPQPPTTPTVALLGNTATLPLDYHCNACLSLA